MIQSILTLINHKLSPARFLLGLVFLCAVIWACPALAEQVTLNKGDKIQLPEITLISGEQLPADYYEGQPVVVSYWASWCPYCKRQNERLQTLYPMAQEKGLNLLTINVDEDPDEALKYLESVQPNFPSAFETEAIRAVFGKATFIPKLFVIDAEAKVVEIIPGEMADKDVLGLLKHAPETDQ